MSGLCYDKSSDNPPPGPIIVFHLMELSMNFTQVYKMNYNIESMNQWKKIPKDYSFRRF